MCTGRAAITYLAEQCDKADPAESSHWQKYHSEFRFLGNRFEGLKGFGGTKSYDPVSGWVHRFMQRRYRKMGHSFAVLPSVDRLAYQITRRQGRLFDLDVLRQVLTIALLKEIIPARLNSGTVVCVIGDGFATLTSLLLAGDCCRQVVLVNLTRTLLVDLWYLKLSLGQTAFDSSVVLVNDSQGIDRAMNDGYRVIAVQALHHALIRSCPIDLVLNIASMQEMNPPVINEYFADLRTIATTRRLDFYCCNREEKALPDGTIVRFDDYPWLPGDQCLLDEYCPWHQEYYAATPPFFRPYDGPIRHRLATLADGA